MLLTSSWNETQKVTLEGGKKTEGERGSETEEIRGWGVGGGEKKKVRLCKSDDIHREGWQKMYVNLLKSSIAKQEFAE